MQITDLITVNLMLVTIYLLLGKVYASAHHLTRGRNDSSRKKKLKKITKELLTIWIIFSFVFSSIYLIYIFACE